MCSKLCIYMDQGKVLWLGFQFMCVCRLHHTAQMIMSCFVKEGGYGSANYALALTNRL